MEIVGAIVLTRRIPIHILSQPQAHNQNSMNRTNRNLTYTELAIEKCKDVAQPSLELQNYESFSSRKVYFKTQSL